MSMLKHLEILMKYSVRRSEDYDSIRGQNLMVFGRGLDRAWEKEACWECFDETGAVAGFCSAHILNEQGEQTLFLSRAAVLPHARGNQLQRRFINTRCRYGKKVGCDVAITYTSPHNTTSSNNLIREGFEMYVPHYKWAGKDMLYWRKVL